VNRRDFFGLRSIGTDTAEVSCERLFIHYRDALNAGEGDAFLKRAGIELAKTRRLLLKDSFWLEDRATAVAIKPLLAAHEARGGTVEFL
jgi:hypothetical protein